MLAKISSTWEAFGFNQTQRRTLAAQTKHHAKTPVHPRVVAWDTCMVAIVAGHGLEFIPSVQTEENLPTGKHPNFVQVHNVMKPEQAYNLSDSLLGLTQTLKTPEAQCLVDC